MKWSVTYFYNVRFMKSNQLPLSTAMYPPKWWQIIHVDKNIVLNGLTIKKLVPKQQCECPCNKKDYEHCHFLNAYYEQLKQIEFSLFIDDIEQLTKRLHSYIKNLPKIDEIVLLVYEKPNNPCSERIVLQKWFKENGIELKEMEVSK